MENPHGRLEALIDAAVRAPSGDNTQPWRFLVDSDQGRMTLRVDEGRDRSPMNAGQRMARIAAGAALENLLQTARLCGWPVAVEPCRAPDLAVVHVVGGPARDIKAGDAVAAGDQPAPL